METFKIYAILIKYNIDRYNRSQIHQYLTHDYYKNKSTQSVPFMNSDFFLIYFPLVSILVNFIKIFGILFRL